MTRTPWYPQNLWPAVIVAGALVRDLDLLFVPLPPRNSPLHAVPGDKFAALKAISVTWEDLDEVADAPVEWVWDQAVPVGGSCLIGAGPGAGKTTLAFLLMAARDQVVPTEVLGRRVNPAPAGQYVVIVENEHSPRSAGRRLKRARALLGLGRDRPLQRTLVVCRESVFVGDARWGLVEAAVKDGLVSDIVLDTLASSTTQEANDEQAQIELFKRFKTLQRASPRQSLTLWILAHTRKAEGLATMADISGSTQRTGQVDTVIIATANRDKETRKVKSVTITFEKLREEPDDPSCEDGIDPIRYKIAGGKLVVLSSKNKPGQVISTEARDAQVLKRVEASGSEGCTASGLSATGLGFKPLVVEALARLVKSGRVRVETRDVRGNECEVFLSSAVDPSEGLPEKK